MSPAPLGNNRVLKGFIAQANAAYRDAGLPEYQMRLKRDGTVDIPNKPKLARGGAATGSAGAAAIPAGAAPQLTQVASPAADKVQLTWAPVSGAVKYGVWQNGTHIGNVSNPSYIANVPADAAATIAIDAEFASGARSTRTPAVSVSRQGTAAVQASVAGGNQAAAAQGGQTAAAPNDAAAGAAATAPAAAAR